ncbi:MAG: hypothetical protein LBP54_09120, partial [Campylobacteraceae bacterium]|nr:hypothetical protein [Campylobacteraceae bacterium]
TDKEQNPWWELTLDKPRFVEYIILHNRKDMCKEKARKLTVEVFYNEKYHVIYQGDLLFDTEPNGLPLILPYKYHEKIERIKITSQINEYFHLSKVNVLSAERVLNEAEKVFIKEFKLNESWFTGETFDPNFTFRTDPVYLFGNFKNSDIISQINAIEITNFMRFGNAVMALSNAYSLAKKYDIKTLIIHNDFEWFKDTIIINGIQIIKKRFIDTSNKLILKSKFFYRKTLASLYEKEFFYCNMLQELKSGFNFTRHYEKQNNADCLWIHFRSGDVFRGNGAHKLYGQPPLAFYEKIINERKWDTINLVSEDMGNPCLSFLQKRFIDTGQNFELFSSDLKSDIEHLLMAQNLVIARGSFILPIICLSDNIKNIYGFCEGGLKSWGLLNDKIGFKKELSISMYKDVDGQYSDILKSWDNSDQQCQKMLEYPADKIEIDYIYNR